MIKNKMMRIASVLLVAVLLSTCAISGTFAKYVTSADATDSARVAKWGVSIVVSNDSNLFSDSYTDAVLNKVTVQTSSAGTNLVAPGTSSVENGGTTTITITGTPEVATIITALIDNTTAKDVYLLAGTYADLTTEADDTFILQEDYYPVKWTLTQKVGQNAATTLVDAKKLSDVVAAFAAYTAANEFVEPNSTLDVTFTLDWEWAFESNNDAADTLLGQLAAGKIIADTDGKYCLDIGYLLEVTVEQVD